MGCDGYYPDTDYDFLIKKEEQKDGLYVYKPKSVIKYTYQIKCPLCKCRLSDKEDEILQNKLNNVSENRLMLKLINIIKK